MWLLYFVGIFAGYLLTLNREKRRFPWGIVLFWLAVILLIVAGVLYIAVAKYGFKLVLYWPFIKH
jgi:sec-independent protein translocase protein TatC